LFEALANTKLFHALSLQVQVGTLFFIIANFLLIIDLIGSFHLSKIFSLTFMVTIFKVRYHEL